MTMTMRPIKRSISRPSLAIAMALTAFATPIHSFAPLARPASPVAPASSSTALDALGVFVRKAKEADVRQYCAEGPPASVLALLQQIKDARAAGDDGAPAPAVGPLQALLTKRRGTLTVIAEYKRKLEGSGFLTEIPPPATLSPVFREFGAAAVAVLADARTGGCSYADVAAFRDEQRGARGEVPGPLPVLSSELVVDEVQIARAADGGAAAVTTTYGVVGAEKVRQFIGDARAVGLEVVVNVGSAEEAQGAVDAGAGIVSVAGLDGAESKAAVIEGLAVPEGRSVCTVANILAKDNKALEEVEEAWLCRDRGFNCVWVSDALYKSGNDPVEHPGAIIQSMKAKSSVKFASPKARSGKGEGATEYLGDIMM